MTVSEHRDQCSRLNVLKLWEETSIDLDALGLKAIDPDYCNKKVCVKLVPCVCIIRMLCLPMQ